MILPDPSFRSLVDALYGHNPDVVIATINEKAGTFTVGSCTSPLPTSGAYEDAAAGRVYAARDGSQAGPLASACRPDVVTGAGEP